MTRLNCKGRERRELMEKEMLNNIKRRVNERLHNAQVLSKSYHLKEVNHHYVHQASAYLEVLDIIQSEEEKSKSRERSK